MTLSQNNDEILEKFGQSLETRTAMFSKESDLPYPKVQILLALTAAAEGPACRAYRKAFPGVIETSMRALLTCVPDHELASTESLWAKVKDVDYDETAVEAILEHASEAERLAVLVVLNAFGEFMAQQG